MGAPQLARPVMWREVPSPAARSSPGGSRQVHRSTPKVVLELKRGFLAHPMSRSRRLERGPVDSTENHGVMVLGPGNALLPQVTVPFARAQLPGAVELVCDRNSPIGAIRP
jgi:hypothetical protein